jgi:Holliday junction DNA helicase RuvB
LEEYIGQRKLKQMLIISIGAALSRGEAMGHCLFYGGAGLGKSSLAAVIANELGSKLHTAMAPSIESPRDIVGIVCQLQPGDVLFIDEIHRLPKVAEELLYPALEDFVLTLTSGKGNHAKTLNIPLPHFTLIGATTRAGSIANPLRDRFNIVHRLQFYDADELAQIVTRTAGILNLEIDAGAARVIAERSRGTPRIANRLVRLVRDYAQVYEFGLTAEVAAEALQQYQVDEQGLDETDRLYLKVLIEQYGGGPVGLEAIAATIGEDADTLEDVYEPFLIQKGFIQRTSRGRAATAAAQEHIAQGART